MTFVLSKLQAYLAMAVAGLLALALAGQTLRLHNTQRLLDKTITAQAMEREVWAEERANAATALALATEQARKTEQTLTAEAAKTEASKNEKIHALTGRADDLARRLRVEAGNAATARLLPGAAAVAGTQPTAPVCDGDRLSNRASDDLVRLAARAETVRVQLEACTASYERARVALGGKP